ncbi:aryl-sulfate sulfotransferase [Echinicola sp. CAU 1574]|uniref:Aryl-sulfate sulfotransferase n=1 Tax=Echinicola arenosa TaxID=2774144 RepID=A0ABR9AHX3_9BACT|nr:aryl-sulfate sulfotransferase [Echinicola arenosa]MBD8488396.1 aryl-sulfate sulfotransferase [Echinicola arenosa]
MKKTGLAIVITCLGLLTCFGFVYYSNHNIRITKVELVSPENSALKEDLSISLSEASPLKVEYWKKGDDVKYTTPISEVKVDHLVHLLLLEPGTTYEYRIVIDGWIDQSTDVLSFQTREASSWMIHEWIKEDKPHDKTAMGDGLVMLCYRGYPGYISMVDGEGTIRWYWQDKNLGVRLATITPRNTILALLAPARKDEFKKPEKGDNKGVASYYLRTGKIGFVGGTEIAEIDLEGNVLWRTNLEEKGIVFHHDLRMTDDHKIMSIYRDYKLYDLPDTPTKIDTLWGDGVMIMDTLGNVLDKWSAWNVWDISKDIKIKEYAGDRFHFNSVNLDTDGNYLLSTPIENQVWKVDSKSGEIIWKLGKGGDFEMDSSSYFYFQHSVYINRNGDLMLFDNGDFSPNDTSKVNKVSRSLAFKLDTEQMKAEVQIDNILPKEYYTSRMGSAFLMPNDYILQTISKTGKVAISNQNGEVLWTLNSHFIPYRAEYIPATLWSDYFKIDQ